MSNTGSIINGRKEPRNNAATTFVENGIEMFFVVYKLFIPLASADKAFGQVPSRILCLGRTGFLLERTVLGLFYGIEDTVGTTLGNAS